MTTSSDETAPVVVVIDDDGDVRVALAGLFRSVGLDVAPFVSVRAWLEAGLPDRLGCMVLDVRLPGQSGLDFQDELVRSNRGLPIIFISGHADIAMSVRAMKAGAIEFLAKPVRDQDLLDAVQLAIAQDRRRRREEQRQAKLRADYEALTTRERQILAQVVTGRRNKQIAADLGVTEATVKLHRGHVMQKMQARSLVELVRIADGLGLKGPPTSTKV